MAINTGSEKQQEPSPSREVVTAFHRNCDVDSSDNAKHHRLGYADGQAAPGKHDHRDGNGMPLLEDFVFTGSRSLNTATVLAQVLDALEALGATDSTTA